MSPLSIENKKINLQKVSERDLPFLFHLYVDVRQREMINSGIHESMIQPFLKTQFDLQHESYRRQYPHAEFYLIKYKKTPIGRLYYDINPDELLLIEISVLSDYRGKGIGRDILMALKRTSSDLGKPMTLQVEKNNEAYHLYSQLGFVKVAENDTRYVLTWSTQIE